MVNDFCRRFFAMLRFTGRQHGHKGLTEGTLCKQSSEQIRNTKGYIKCIGECAGAKSGGNQKLSDQARDTGSQGPKGNSRGRFKKAHVESVAIPQRVCAVLDSTAFGLLQ